METKRATTASSSRLSKLPSRGSQSSLSSSRRSISADAPRSSRRSSVSARGKPRFVPRDEYEKAALAIFEADYMLVSAGAGFSADSGLPVYRDIASVPAYEKMDVTYRDLCEPRWLNEDADIFYGFWGSCYNQYEETPPHEGYKILLRWRDLLFPKSSSYFEAATEEEDIEQKMESNHDGLPEEKERMVNMLHSDRKTVDVRLSANLGATEPKVSKRFFILTSNVDGHFIRSGFDPDEVFEIHGNVYRWQCHQPCSLQTWNLAHSLEKMSCQRLLKHIRDGKATILYEKQVEEQSAAAEQESGSTTSCTTETTVERFQCVPGSHLQTLLQHFRFEIESATMRCDRWRAHHKSQMAGMKLSLGKSSFASTDSAPSIATATASQSKGSTWNVSARAPLTPFERSKSRDTMARLFPSSHAASASSFEPIFSSRTADWRDHREILYRHAAYRADSYQGGDRVSSPETVSIANVFQEKAVAAVSRSLERVALSEASSVDATDDLEDCNGVVEVPVDQLFMKNHIPCIRCGGKARPAILMWEDEAWIWSEWQEKHWTRWAKSVRLDVTGESGTKSKSTKRVSTISRLYQQQPRSSSRPPGLPAATAAKPRRAVILELGCGTRVPTLREKCERYLSRLAGKGTLVRVNPDFPGIKQSKLKEHTISIRNTGLDTLKKIDLALQKIMRIHGICYPSASE